MTPSSQPLAFLKDHLSTVAVLLVPALAVVVWPFVVGFDESWTNVVLLIEIYLILALGLNVVVGYTGLLDLGYVSFMAVGAVMTCLCLVMTIDPDTGRIVFPIGDMEYVAGEHPLIFPGSYLLILLASGLVCALLGVLRGIPTLRLSGDYYAIVTLGIAEIIFLVLYNEEWLTGGAFAIKLRRDAIPKLLGEPLYWDAPHFYFLLFAVLVVTVLVLYRLQYSRVGRAWAAIRLDETAARSCGVNVYRYKLLAFAVSGFVGGVGGSLYAVWGRMVAVKGLDVWQSIIILCCIVLGGMGSIKGVILGTALLVVIGEAPRYELVEGFKPPAEARFLIYGVLIILLMRFRPQGLLPLKPRRVAVDQGRLDDVAKRPPELFGLAHESEGAAK